MEKVIPQTSGGILEKGLFCKIKKSNNSKEELTMVRRSEKSQTKHDRKVRERAQTLREQGFNVRADIAGFKKPHSVQGYRPDVEARKYGKVRIIEEVETKNSLEKDQSQQTAFEKYAERKGIKFVIRLTK